MKFLQMLLTAVMLTACGGENFDVSPVNQSQQVIVAGAGYTTWDSTLLGCDDSPNGVNCNHYTSKDKVYTSGGPTGASLSDGTYYFSVLVPGFQNSGFVDGSIGNLSDTTANVTAGDFGTGDDFTNRTFTSVGGVITYAGTHAIGTSPLGHFVMGLYPFDNTDNSGGVYILAICLVGATKSKDCKYDAFKAPPDCTDPEGCDPILDEESIFGYIGGMKYYDANANGQLDEGEVGIPGWQIHLVDGVEDVLTTDAAGEFGVSLVADLYHFNELLPLVPTTWIQTGNLVDQTQVDGDATATLNPDKTYSIDLFDNSNVLGVVFGNLCIGAGGGLTLGFWSNKNGQALVGADDLALLVSLNLRNGNGSSYDPPSKTSLRTWLLNGTAVNMAYMLSVQLTAMELNVLNGFASGSSLVLAPGTLCANVNGFCSVTALMAEANVSLGLNPVTMVSGPVRTYQEALKNALDNANNNRTFVQASPATCPVPLFQ